MLCNAYEPMALGINELIKYIHKHTNMYCIIEHKIAPCP